MDITRKAWAVLPPPHKPLEEYTKDEILWLLRTELEGAHRRDTRLYAVNYSYLANLNSADNSLDMTDGDFFDTCNKSVPIYILLGPHWFAVGRVLHNYIYRRWFRPYRSDIEASRFICKFITPSDMSNSSPPSKMTVNTLVSLNETICAQVEAHRRTFAERLEQQPEFTRAEWRASQIENNGLYQVQPLFRALLIIISCKDYRRETSADAGRIPVFLVRTGVEEGLSAPITFDGIEDRIDGNFVDETGNTVLTTLETAIDFVMNLEAREAAEFGLQPEPVAAWKPHLDHLERTAPEWKAIVGEELLLGPGSKFVDTDKYPEWTGSGKDHDSRIMVLEERRGLRQASVGIADA